MSQRFEVDQFASIESQRELVGRSDETLATLGALGLLELEPADAVMVFGGSATALQLVDTYIPHRRGFDVDVVVPTNTFNEIGEKWGFDGGIGRFRNGAQGRIRPRTSIPVPVDVMTSDDPTVFELFTGGLPAAHATIAIEGVRVVTAEIIAAQKAGSNSTRVKDLAGIIKAHVVASATQNPVLDTSLWGISVGVAADRITTQNLPKNEVSAWRRITKKGPNYPSWLQQLVERDFEHPAFENIPRESKK